jgi:hypothetical protein
VLSLHGRDLLEVRFVRIRITNTQHDIEAFWGHPVAGRFSPTYKTPTPADCWFHDYKLTKPRMDSVELWETSQASALVAWMGQARAENAAENAAEKMSGEVASSGPPVAQPPKTAPAPEPGAVSEAQRMEHHRIWVMKS